MSNEDKHDDKGHDDTTTVIVNGREKKVKGEELSFDQIVKLAFDTPPTGDNVVYTITYRKGPGKHPEGTVLEGKSVEIKDGMIFNVTATDKS